MYLPEKFIHIADHLSRNFNKSNAIKDDESTNDIMHTIIVVEIKFSEKKIQECKKVC